MSNSREYMKYRSRIQIVAEILESITSIVTTSGDNGKATSTKIMYKAFLSYTQLKEYLDLLLRNDLIRYQESKGTFIITDKGMHLLELYNKLNKSISTKQIMVPSFCKPAMTKPSLDNSTTYYR
jgi:predicted transcriptional regulator